MGIPTLARRLEPYATKYSPQDLNGYTAIIDGPSLAYHAHKLALAAGASTGRIPSYADINHEAIRWLKSLEDLNIRVSAILFDGALPDSKKSERSARLDRYVRQMTTFKSFHPAGSCPIPRELGTAIYAFLAPSLREALSETNYAQITRVVPGEADDWCPLYANDNPRSVVFSSDTDLLLYEYPPEFLVVFFRDLDLATEFKGYCPKDICNRLAVRSLVPLAFAITQEPYNSLTENVLEAANIDVESDQYLDFSKRYMGIRPSTPSHIARNFTLRAALQQLDVRVSEFVHQSLNYASTPTVYLPLLLEDPNQASAWNMGQDIRVLAYSILPADSVVVQEHKRKAQSIAIQDIKIYTPDETVSGVVELAHDVRTWKQWTAKKQVAKSHVWALFAASMVLVDLKRPPLMSLITRVLNSDYDNSWDFIHLSARVQSILYSLRFFDQCASIWLAHNDHDTTDLRDVIFELHRDLESLPSLSEIAAVPGQKKQAQGDDETLKAIVGEAYKAAGIAPPEEQKPPKPKKQTLKAAKPLTREEKEQQRKERRRQENISRQHVSNMFAVLGQG
ncbi:hypothetical protein BS50DRAFT_372207 [Corynespora cassiicola Philippines]|uniref:Asteroid domain-containing protein n=1 Tax=Corynespora cassiicola Philippines TaxID=1448308 RepID=A0A2T2NMR4_CORCC|nr:hypothetical protein BS50DRAFT_372207 [Corynespora cassiicola Philippines]